MFNPHNCTNKIYTIFDVFHILIKILASGLLDSYRNLNFTSKIYIYENKTLSFKNVIKPNNKNIMLDIFSNQNSFIKNISLRTLSFSKYLLIKRDFLT